MPPLVEARGFSLALPGAGRLLTAVDFTIAAGERVGWTGESGSGKTLLASCLLGLHPAGALLSGSLQFAGRELPILSARQWRRLRGGEVVMIFQDPAAALNPVRTVGGQLLEIARRHRDRQRAAARRHCLDVLETLGFDDPGAVFQAYPHRLSGGQQQRILIAMAMICRPRLAILDEPSAALDGLTRARLQAQLHELHEQYGTTLWLISHDLSLLAGACDRLLVIYGGRLVEDAPAGELLARPEHPYSRLLADSSPHLGESAVHERLATVASGTPPARSPTGCPYAPRCELAAERCRREMPEWTSRETRSPAGSRRVACFHPLAGDRGAGVGGIEASAAPDTAAVLSAAPGVDAGRGDLLAVRGLRARHPGAGREVLAAVDFALRRGEILGVTGVSGAGKSTLARALFGLVPVTGGEISWQGKRLQPASFRRVAQLLFQNPAAALDPLLTAGQSIGEALSATGRPAGLAARQVVELLSAVQLEATVVGRYPHQLSIGQQARVTIARALAAEPQLLVADEPFAALDAPVQAEIIRLLARLNRERGLAMIVISHDLKALALLAGPVIVIADGRIVETTTMPALLSAPVHPLSRDLVAAARRAAAKR